MSLAIKKKVIDRELLEVYIKKSGFKSSFIYEKMGIRKQAYYQKIAGKTAFRESEIYVIQDLCKIPDGDMPKIFYPQS